MKIKTSINQNQVELRWLLVDLKSGNLESESRTPGGHPVACRLWCYHNLYFNETSWFLHSNLIAVERPNFELVCYRRNGFGKNHFSADWDVEEK